LAKRREHPFKAGFKARLDRSEWAQALAEHNERRSFLPPQDKQSHPSILIWGNRLDRSKELEHQGTLINPRFTQIESVLFSLFLGLESTIVGFDSFNFYRLVQVGIKNQSP
jgi:hypothetical protein